MVAITVNGHQIAPESQQPGGDDFVEDAARSNYILVHCAHSLQAEEYEKLRQLGVEVLTYHDDNTYSCRFEPADLREIRGLAFVEFANVYADKLCLSPSHREALARRVQAARQTSASEAHPPAPATKVHPSEERRWFHVFLHDRRRSHEAVAAIATISSVEKDTMVDEGYGIWRVDFMTRDLDAVARLDDVARIQEVGKRGITNWKARPIIGLDPLAASAFKFSGDKLTDQLPISAKVQKVATALRGAGQTVAVADSGFDKGYAVQLPSGPPLDVHDAFIGRVRDLWSYTADGDFEDQNGHGTHVAGSVLASGTTTTGLRIDGPAPDAGLISQRITDDEGKSAILGPTSSIWTDVMDPTKKRNNQTRVHNNSWGSVWSEDHGQWEYNADATTADNLVYENQDWIIVFAAGNDGERNGGATLGGAPSAKNAITVGACQNTHPLKSTPGHPSTDYKYDDAEPPGSPSTVASFSNRGPVKATARRKPDVLAPGCVVYSARSRMNNLTESKVTLPNGTVVFDGNKHGISDDPRYWYMSGTSMAAPFVSGCCAGLRNLYCSLKGLQPSSAMIKALLVNGAEDVSLIYSPTASREVHEVTGFSLRTWVLFPRCL